MFFLNATDPATIKLAQARDDRLGLHGAARSRTRVATAPRARAGADAASAGDRRQAAAAGRRSSTSSTSRCRADCRSARRARCSTSRTTRSCRSSAIRHEVTDDSDAVFYFPGLRLGAALLAGRARDAGDALARRRADGAAAGLSLLRLSADRRRRRGPRPADHDRQPRAVPPRGQHAQLSRHQDGDRVVRHVHGPAAEVRVRQDLPRLPAARHPRVPAREGRGARRRRRACATCITTPATRR